MSNNIEHEGPNASSHVGLGAFATEKLFLTRPTGLEDFVQIVGAHGAQGNRWLGRKGESCHMVPDHIVWSSHC
jgi:hypothetical protein